MGEVESHWKSLWGENAQHNERAEWIRREESRKMGNIDWGPVQIMEITSFCRNLTNGNLLEVIK
jgi:hypothetical protein